MNAEDHTLLVQENRAERFDAVVRALASAKGLLLTAHELADGDATGSELALAQGLATLGKPVWVINNEPLSARYRFLDPEGRFVRVHEPLSFNQILQDCDTAVVLDNNDRKRLGKLESALFDERRGLQLVCIDHHRFDEPFCDLHL
ncbi:MAG: hypothetical protein KDB53_09545, partial [Planctomycetes bacterium]|nr:hypothetical protein [Planctomycetota bacterium]